MAKKAGYRNIYVLSAGIYEWKAAGHETYTALTQVENGLKTGKIILVDLREAETVKQDGYIPGAVNIPFSEFEDRDDEYPVDRNVPIIFYGDNKDDINEAYSLLVEYLYTNVSIFPDWKKQWQSNNTLAKDAAIATEINWQGKFAANAVSFPEFKKLRKSKDIVIDIREPAEYLYEHLANSISIPLAEVPQKLPPMLEKIPAGAVMYMHCTTGSRAQRAYEVLSSNTAISKKLRDKVFFISTNVQFD